jgi:hypothetical protein
MSPARRNQLACVFVFLVAMLAAKSAAAQATFQTSVAGSTVTEEGHTELTGDITFSVVSGTSVSGRLDITYPVQFANDASTGITISGTGGLAGATLSVAASSGIVIVNIPAGATVGDVVTVKGVRFSEVLYNRAQMDATLSSTGNFITAGQGTVRVVNTSAAGFQMIATPGPSIALASGGVVSGVPTLQIVEGHVTAFTSAVGQLGQTTPTQIIFRIIGLPDNVSLTFPTTVSSSSGATLSTGAPVVLTNQSASNLVVYAFAESATSQSTLDEFAITPIVGAVSPSGTGTAFIQVAIGPFGAAVPTVSLPSTAIPRFAEKFIPPLSSIPGAGVLVMFGTSPIEADETFAISNLGTGAAGLIFRATSAADGSSIQSSTSAVLPAKGTSLVSLSQLFGSTAAPASLSAVQVESLNNRLIGTAVVSAAGGRTTIAASTPELLRFILPFNLTSASRDATMTIINSGTGTADVTLTLRSASGQSISSVVGQIKAGTTFRDTLLNLFFVTAASVPADAYVEGTSSAPVRVTGFANPQGPLEKIHALGNSSVRQYRYPYFVTGEGYSSILTLVNRSVFPLRVTLTPIQHNGALFSGVAPTVRVINVSERADIDVATLVPATSSLTTGSVFMNLERADSPNPFSTPEVAGTMRTKTATSSTVVPLFLERLTQSYLTPVLESNTTYTGVALLNDSINNITVTVDIFSSAGTLLGTNSFALAAGTARAQLLRELVPAAVGQGETLVRVTSSLPVNIIGFRGGLNSTELLYLQPQQ